MDLNSTPRLALGCRVHPTENVLLIPEGMLNLTGPTREILMRLDGSKSVTEVVRELLEEYAQADAAEVEADVLNVLNRLAQRGVIKA